MICIKKWLLNDIANELRNSDCPPPQARYCVVCYFINSEN